MTHPSYGPSELNQGFVVAIQLEANVGEEDRLAESLERLIEPTMSEPGVKLFLPYRSPTNPSLFFVFELTPTNRAGRRTRRPITSRRR